jgi:hypothetical protein
MQILYPAIALAFWTFVVLMRVPVVRVRAGLIHRLTAFALSNVALVSLWVLAAVHIVSRGQG